MSTVTAIHCRICRCRLYWTGHFDASTDPICWTCANTEEQEWHLRQEAISEEMAREEERRQSWCVFTPTADDMRDTIRNEEQAS